MHIETAQNAFETYRHQPQMEGRLQQHQDSELFFVEAIRFNFNTTAETSGNARQAGEDTASTRGLDVAGWCEKTTGSRAHLELHPTFRGSVVIGSNINF